MNYRKSLYDKVNEIKKFVDNLKFNKIKTDANKILLQRNENKNPFENYKTQFEQIDGINGNETKTFYSIDPQFLVELYGNIQNTIEKHNRKLEEYGKKLDINEVFDINNQLIENSKQLGNELKNASNIERDLNEKYNNLLNIYTNMMKCSDNINTANKNESQYYRDIDNHKNVIKQINILEEELRQQQLINGISIDINFLERLDNIKNIYFEKNPNITNLDINDFIKYINNLLSIINEIPRLETELRQISSNLNNIVKNIENCSGVYDILCYTTKDRRKINILTQIKPNFNEPLKQKFGEKDFFSTIEFLTLINEKINDNVLLRKLQIYIKNPNNILKKIREIIRIINGLETEKKEKENVIELYKRIREQIGTTIDGDILEKLKLLFNNINKDVSIVKAFEDKKNESNEKIIQIRRELEIKEEEKSEIDRRIQQISKWNKQPNIIQPDFLNILNFLNTLEGGTNKTLDETMNEIKKISKYKEVYDIITNIILYTDKIRFKTLIQKDIKNNMKQILLNILNFLRQKFEMINKLGLEFNPFPFLSLDKIIQCGNNLLNKENHELFIKLNSCLYNLLKDDENKYIDLKELFENNKNDAINILTLLYVC